MTTILVDPRPERDAGSPSDKRFGGTRPAMLLLIPLVLAGCGLKGDLYLPDDQTATPPPATVEEDSEQES